MKNLLFITLMLPFRLLAQSEVYDKAVVHQNQRMVFQQWDQDKFDPAKGFLGLNPYYWLVWGLFDPNYHKTDLRPLSPAGPQTQRLVLAGAMSSTDEKYKLHSDTLSNTALSQIAGQSGLLSDADPLWILYYKRQFEPVLGYSAASLLGGFSAQVSAKLISEGTYSWYTSELSSLKERLQGARQTDMDRSSRIMAYYRLLKEYECLSGVWAIRTSATEKDLQLNAKQRSLGAGTVSPGNWTPQRDVQIAAQVLSHAKY